MVLRKLQVCGNSCSAPTDCGLYRSFFKMMCEVMPTISEAEGPPGGGGSHGSGSPSQPDADSHFEQPSGHTKRDTRNTGINPGEVA